MRTGVRSVMLTLTISSGLGGIDHLGDDADAADLGQHLLVPSGSFTS